MIEAIMSFYATELGHRIARSIREDVWRSGDGYHLVRADGKISIWIANKDYGIRVATRERFPGRSVEVRPSYADRKLIWGAVKALGIPSPESMRAAEALKAI